MFTASHQAVQGAPAAPPVYSLLGVAATSPMPFDHAAGIKWLPELVGESRGLGGLTQCGASATMSVADGPTATGLLVSDPLWVWSADRATSTGWRAADYAGRARRALAATQSYFVAAELWDGAITLAANAADTNVLTQTSSDELTTAGVSALDGFAMIEQGIAKYGLGKRGMIHCTPQVLMQVHAFYCLEHVSGVWLTPMGNVVVADAGYSGKGPVGKAAPSTTQWIYGTDMIEFELDAVQLFPNADPLTDEVAFMAEAMDRTVNKVTVYAGRVVIWKWDRMIHVAAEVNVPVPAFGGN